ncbi:MAG: hypothetical protein P8N51_02940 [Pseudomonadales bacterium]|nr:hypothetical protein [Pseudomonadales bacterium]MDG1441243.1 hypothetical protein [Pseudomonadales bacterium]
MTELIAGPLWAARNWNIEDGAGSIHDDDTAAELGFRGGTVAGDIHMNQFPPILVEVFGNEWFERGNLSLNFKNATIDLEKVQAFAEPLKQGENQVRVWMEREDGLLVCEGTAAIGDHSNSELRRKNLHPCDPKELRILRRCTPGMSLGSYDIVAKTDVQFERYDRNLISDPMTWYKEGSPWGDPIAAPCTILEFLWGNAMRGLGPLVEESTGLFGAMEISHTNGPLIMGKKYRIDCEVVCVSQSPKTEIVWYDQHAYNEAGDHVVTLRIQSRAMKASSPLYAASELG